jgi:hypothetical protein
VASLRTRTLSTLAMIGGFVSIIYLGHVPLMLLVLTLQVRVCGGACLWVFVGGEQRPRLSAHPTQPRCVCVLGGGGS